jgi:hypothetical protein
VLTALTETPPPSSETVWLRAAGQSQFVSEYFVYYSEFFDIMQNAAGVEVVGCSTILSLAHLHGRLTEAPVRSNTPSDTIELTSGSQPSLSRYAPYI